MILLEHHGIWRSIMVITETLISLRYEIHLFEDDMHLIM